MKRLLGLAIRGLKGWGNLLADLNRQLKLLALAAVKMKERLARLQAEEIILFMVLVTKDQPELKWPVYLKSRCCLLRKKPNQRSLKI
jgi:hypothetical protein